MRMPRAHAKKPWDPDSTDALPRLRDTSGGSVKGWRPAVFVGPKAKGVRLQGDGDAFSKVGNDRLRPDKKKGRKAAQQEAESRKKQEGRTRRPSARTGTAEKAAASAAAVAEKAAAPISGFKALPKAARVALIALAVVLIVVASLYGPVRDWYVAGRRSQDLTARYEQLAESNEKLQGEVQSLQTPDGIKDEARKRGYVEKGEVPVTVNGGADADSDDSAQDGSTPISGKDIAHAPVDGATAFWDKVFQYQSEE